MRDAATSVLVFGVYVLALGAALLVVPNLLLGVFGIAATQEVWIRILGGVLVGVSFYYIGAARSRGTWFFRASVIARIWVAAVLFALVILGLAPPIVALFGLTDLAAAGWTAYALRSPQPRASA